MADYVRCRGKKLIVSADDFGLTRGVNEAIVRAYREGIVTSASLIVSGSAFESAVTMAKVNPGLGIGLHLYLGNDPVTFAKKCFLGKVRDADLEREIRRQIEMVLNAGVQLTHIDGHKHVHVIPQVTRAISRTAPNYGIRAVRSVAETTPGLARMFTSNPRAGRDFMKQFLFGKMASAMWKVSRGKVSQARLATSNRFYGITQTGFLDFDVLTSIIHHLRPGVSELMCHPGYIDDDLKRTPTRLLLQRERELDLLTRSEVRDLIVRSGVELISYKDLVEGYGSSDSDAVLHRHSAL